jgi:4-hydroxy-3-methylbut-2-enyl diphosphate reductase
METVEALKTRFPQLSAPPSDDICYATQNRQSAARKIGAAADLVIVVGSRNSSNSQRLVEVALQAGANAAHLVDSADEIDAHWLQEVSTIGVTSGASVPDVLVDDVLRWLAAHGYEDVEIVETAAEHQHFALPRELTAPIRQATDTTERTA